MTPTTDRDELVERLLEMAPESGKTIACVDRTTREMNATIRQAANRIQADAATIAAKDAEIERLTRERDYLALMEKAAHETAVAAADKLAALKGGDHGIAAMGEGDVR